jgi:hypothetical protein
MSAKLLRQLLVAIVCAWAVGCKGSPGPPPPPPPPAKIPTGPVGDDVVMVALDYYEPMYQVDANGRVIKLRLTGRHLPGPVLAEVGKLKELRNLDLYGAILTDNDLAHLKDLSKLRALGLGGTAITEQGLAHLEKLPGLEYVWLPKSTVSREAADKLENTHPNLKKAYLQQ